MQRIKPTVQDYSTYTSEDFYVWRLLYERQLPFVQANASQLYLDALDKIGFNADEIPHFDETSKRLQQHTKACLTPPFTKLKTLIANT